MTIKVNVFLLTSEGQYTSNTKTFVIIILLITLLLKVDMIYTCSSSFKQLDLKFKRSPYIPVFLRIIYRIESCKQKGHDAKSKTINREATRRITC